MTEAERREALRLAIVVGGYAAHKSDCSTRLSFSNPASDYCDCGYAEAARNYRKLLDILEGRK